MDLKKSVSISDIEADIEKENFKKEYKTEIDNPKLNLCCCKIKQAILLYAFFHFALIIFYIFVY